IAFASIAGTASAQCVGDSYLDGLTDAQQTALATTIADMPFSEGLIWSATKGEDTLTIVGTMHIYDPRLDAIAARVADQVANADLLLVEATDADEAALQTLITQEPDRLFITDGPTLPDLLDEDMWAMLSEAATDRGIPGFMAAQMQPWYLSLLLAIPTCAMADLTAGQPGLDKMIMEQADAAGVPIASVEPFTTLFEIFGDQPVDEQLDTLRVSLMEPDLQQEMFVAMLDRYFAEDIGQLWEMSRLAVGDIADLDPDEGAAMFAEMEDGLLVQRNRNWIPVILDATESHDDVVIAVGAAHLIDDDGILQLLQNEGWTLTRQTSP
ncbi:MAG: TraB/GumN family protein, partial [Pseudomonadota bacterium]